MQASLQQGMHEILLSLSHSIEHWQVCERDVLLELMQFSLMQSLWGFDVSMRSSSGFPKGWEAAEAVRVSSSGSDRSSLKSFLKNNRAELVVCFASLPCAIQSPGAPEDSHQVRTGMQLPCSSPPRLQHFFDTKTSVKHAIIDNALRVMACPSQGLKG